MHGLIQCNTEMINHINIDTDIIPIVRYGQLSHNYQTRTIATHCGGSQLVSELYTNVDQECAWS